MGNDELQPLGALERKIAAEHAFTRVPVASPSASIEQVRRSLGEGAYDSLTHVAILVGTKLVGVLTIESLFSVPGESTVRAPSRWWTRRVISWASSRRTGFWPCCCGSMRRTWIAWAASLGAPRRPAARAKKLLHATFCTKYRGCSSVLSGLCSSLT